MFVNEKKINILFLFWLIVSLILVFLIIIVGGLTRLTDSGLSITKWELFAGLLPPLTESKWVIYFNLYKEIPQYKLLKFNMSIEEFKIIFYWEYFHRILARFIGLFFLIPLIYFYLTKKIDKSYLKICTYVFFLIVFQGIVGWLMVKSGLVDVVTVSHYRLAAHLITAIFIISIIFWLIINFSSKSNIRFFNFKKEYLPFILFIILIYLQIIIGAFVSGLDAGRIYQTWPLMGDSFFPDDVTSKNFFEFEDHSLVQFYHRNLAYFISLYVLILSIYIFKKKFRNLYIPLATVIFFLFLQAILGIFTLTSGLNIYLASAHQITSVFLVFSSLNLYYFKAK
jgi:cytochrome c oxidase assembly protein subunit 15